MFLVIDPLGTGEWWKPLRALRPNWVWWSVDEGWSIDDDDPYQKVYGPVARSSARQPTWLGLVRLGLG